jgi:hypothetical protein
MTAPPPVITAYAPRRPHFAALGVVSLFVAVLALPMLGGRWLAAPEGDQYTSGYAFDAWEANEWRATGRIPLWNPMIMSGLPYIAVVTHGDVLYPTALLRRFLPVDVVMNFAFVLHYILAGFLTYLFLRRLGTSWAGAVTGGVAYQLSGIMISLVHPGHEGKLFVSTMLPLAFLALLAALRDRRSWGYPLLAVAIALCLLSPHVQATYYLLIAAGLFALYLTFGEQSVDPLPIRLTRLGVALGAIIVGFGVAMPQILPFLEYIPHSPRAGGYSVGYQAGSSFGVPWDHVPEFLIAGFTGETHVSAPSTYWGSNGLKLHSEYLGLSVIALALLGLGDRRRRLVWWVAGIGLLFLLIALGGATPFYRLWWSVMPYVRKTRAPGMVFFVVALCTATFAALGVNRLERGEGMRHVRAFLIASAVVALLALIGAFGQLAVALAPPGHERVASALGPTIRLSGFIGAGALAVVAVVALARLRGRISPIAFAVALPLLVGADLWRDGRRYWVFSEPPNQSIYRVDEIVARLQREPKPYRVLNFDVYPQNLLMAHEIPQVLGYQGQELRYYDELLGGRNEWRYLLSSTRLWHLLAVRFVIMPDTTGLPGYHRILGPVQTAAGPMGYLWEADSPPPYARVAPAATKVDEQLIPPTLADPRLPGFDRIVLLPQNAPINPRPLTALPAPSRSRARVTAWKTGAMSIELDPAPTDSSYVLVSENWYLDWRVGVDGRPGQVLRGDHALLSVPVGPGARRLDFSYHSRTFARGTVIAIVSIIVMLAGFFVPPLVARRRSSA